MQMNRESMHSIRTNRCSITHTLAMSFGCCRAASSRTTNHTKLVNRLRGFHGTLYATRNNCVNKIYKMYIEMDLFARANKNVRKCLFIVWKSIGKYYSKIVGWCMQAWLDLSANVNCGYVARVEPSRVEPSRVRWETERWHQEWHLDKQIVAVNELYTHIYVLLPFLNNIKSKK